MPLLWAIAIAVDADRARFRHDDECGAKLALLVPVQHLKAEFADGAGRTRELLQSSEGYVRIARPQRLKWVLSAPYPQTVVTVGDRLYVYDPDLQQVQVNPLAEALRGTPALVLLGTAAQIEAQFEVDAKTQTVWNYTASRRRIRPPCTPISE
jgi:outer membrane lipoprotein carrier protein